MQYSIKERIYLVKQYYSLRYSILVQRKWRTDMETDPPQRETINKLIKKFESTGSVKNDNRNKGRRKSATNFENVERVKNVIDERPKSSTRRVSAELNLSQSSTCRILKHELKMKPYRPRLIHQLLEDDFDRRLEFCQQFLEMVDSEPDLTIWWSDESTFKLNGEVNRHNCVYWSAVNPHASNEMSIKSPGLCVWAAISRKGVIGPYFFDGSVTGDKYHQMLENFFYPQLMIKNGEDDYFMQDGAPPHYANVVRHWLNIKFPGRWIGRRGAVDWPPRSPDLTPADFFLWGHLKNEVYSQPSHNLEELKLRIEHKFAELNIDFVKDACSSVAKRCKTCIEAKGEQFEYLT